eukprot:Lankesteria_metandrocarpae@DN3986_c0_g1_i1.p1
MASSKGGVRYVDGADDINDTPFGHELTFSGVGGALKTVFFRQKKPPTEARAGGRSNVATNQRRSFIASDSGSVKSLSVKSEPPAAVVPNKLHATASSSRGSVQSSQQYKNNTTGRPRSQTKRQQGTDVSSRSKLMVQFAGEDTVTEAQRMINAMQVKVIFGSKTRKCHFHDNEDRFSVAMWNNWRLQVPNPDFFSSQGESVARFTRNSTCALPLVDAALVPFLRPECLADETPSISLISEYIPSPLTATAKIPPRAFLANGSTCVPVNSSATSGGSSSKSSTNSNTRSRNQHKYEKTVNTTPVSTKLRFAAGMPTMRTMSSYFSEESRPRIFAMPAPSGQQLTTPFDDPQQSQQVKGCTIAGPFAVIAPSDCEQQQQAQIECGGRNDIVDEGEKSKQRRNLFASNAQPTATSNIAATENACDDNTNRQSGICCAPSTRSLTYQFDSQLQYRRVANAISQRAWLANYCRATFLNLNQNALINLADANETSRNLSLLSFKEREGSGSFDDIHNNQSTPSPSVAAGSAVKLSGDDWYLTFENRAFVIAMCDGHDGPEAAAFAASRVGSFLHHFWHNTWGGSGNNTVQTLGSGNGTSPQTSVGGGIRRPSNALLDETNESSDRFRIRSGLSIEEYTRQVLKMSAAMQDSCDGGNRVQEISEVFGRTFAALDMMFREAMECLRPPCGPKSQLSTAGSCLLTVLVVGKYLWCANIGDCRGAAVTLHSDVLTVKEANILSKEAEVRKTRAEALGYRYDDQLPEYSDESDCDGVMRMSGVDLAEAGSVELSSSDEGPTTDKRNRISAEDFTPLPNSSPGSSFDKEERTHINLSDLQRPAETGSRRAARRRRLLGSAVLIGGTLADTNGNVTVNRLRVTWLNREHRASDPLETKRIRSLGGLIANGRLHGLEPSRTVGDFDVKLSQPAGVLTPMPEITSLEITRPTLLILATDGIWEVTPRSKLISDLEKSKRLWTRIRKWLSVDGVEESEDSEQKKGGSSSGAASSGSSRNEPTAEELEYLSEMLIQLARKRGSADDASVVVVYLKPQMSD